MNNIIINQNQQNSNEKNNQITLQSLLNLIKTYNEEALDDVKKAYALADYLHQGQMRESGEPYISHPLNVAYILATMHADCATLCAGLLHDTLEDTNISKKELTEIFDDNIANLVDGVTKLAKMNFSTKKAQNLANTRKIITGITEDVRIIIIKLADRLHNMKTLEHKKPIKQLENARETMDIFVPLAYHIGAYELKSELEDLSLKYIDPENYRDLLEKRQLESEESTPCLKEMEHKIKNILNERNIKTTIKTRTKNVYGIYKYQKQGHKINEIHDLHAIKILVDNIDECYLVLRAIHENYPLVPGKFKDYLWNSKTNMYRSLHTTVFGPDQRIIQIQIRTHDMDKINNYGLTAYWDINKGEARHVMQNKLRTEFPFYKFLQETDKMYPDDNEFVTSVTHEIFTDNVYALNPDGISFGLPLGATIIDYAYIAEPEIANMMVDVAVNDRIVPMNYQIQNKDRIRIITSPYSTGPKPEWLDYAKTSYVKTKIKSNIKKGFSL